nr:MAG TPA: hypothetical protein [Bacteriophage sp.]
MSKLGMKFAILYFHFIRCITINMYLIWIYNFTIFVLRNFFLIFKSVCKKISYEKTLKNGLVPWFLVPPGSIFSKLIF